MTEQNYTFQLAPGKSTRHPAGPYDQETHSPRYEIEISVPSYVRHQIEVKQFLMGKEGSRIWVWDIKNNSTYPAFVIIKKDGALLRIR